MSVGKNRPYAYPIRKNTRGKPGYLYGVKMNDLKVIAQKFPYDEPDDFFYGQVHGTVRDLCTEIRALRAVVRKLKKEKAPLFDEMSDFLNRAGYPEASLAVDCQFDL